MRRSIYRPLATLALAILLAVATPPRARAVETLSPDLVRLIPTLMPMTVNINFLKYENREGQPGALVPVHKGVGSGYIVDPDGLIVTNRHVTDGGDEIYVTLNDNTRLRAAVVYRSPDIDLAVLQVHADHKLTAVRWGDSDRMVPGQLVIAIGNPLGLGGTVTTGIVSARDRDIKVSPLDSFMQIDAAINPGNSGGPLFNSAGELIGMNTAIFTVGSEGGSVGLAFAIPGNDVQLVLKNLHQYGRAHNGYLGAVLQDVTHDMAEALSLPHAMGAIVAEVRDDSPAARAGLADGDIVLRIGDHDIPNLRAALRAISSGNTGKPTAFVIQRDGARHTLSVKLDEVADDTNKITLDTAPPRLRRITHEELGIEGEAATEDLLRKYGVKPGLKGFMITKVADKSLGAYVGFEVGDLLMRVQNTPVDNVDDLTRAIDAAIKQQRRRVMVLLYDDRGARWIAVPIAR
jgi:serine protease Do